MGVLETFLCRACGIGISHCRGTFQHTSLLLRGCREGRFPLEATAARIPRLVSPQQCPTTFLVNGRIQKHLLADIDIPLADTVKAATSNPQTQQQPRSHIYSCQQSQAELQCRLEVGSAGLGLCSLGVVPDAAVAGASREIAFIAVLRQNPQPARLPLQYIPVTAWSLQKLGASRSCQATCVEIQRDHMPTRCSSTRALPQGHCAR